MRLSRSTRSAARWCVSVTGKGPPRGSDLTESLTTLSSWRTDRSNRTSSSRWDSYSGISLIICVCSRWVYEERAYLYCWILTRIRIRTLLDIKLFICVLAVVPYLVLYCIVLYVLCHMLYMNTIRNDWTYTNNLRYSQKMQLGKNAHKHNSLDGCLFFTTIKITHIIGVLRYARFSSVGR